MVARQSELVTQWLLFRDGADQQPFLHRIPHIGPPVGLMLVWGGAARDIDSGNQRLFRKHPDRSAHRLTDALMVDELELRRKRRQPQDAHADPIRVFAVIMQPLLDQLLIRKARTATVQSPAVPALTVFTKADIVEL